MTDEFIVLSIFLVVFVSVLFAGIWILVDTFYDHIDGLETARREDMREWRKERFELMERIQRPNFTPVAPTEHEPEPDRGFNDNLHLVGTMDLSPEPPDEVA